VFSALVLTTLLAQQTDTPWKRHTIDASLTGADGVRVMDINKDGLPDIATGWEEGRAVRIYYHPPKHRARTVPAWRNETVAQVCAAEDAVFADVDQDRNIDVISACEEKQPTGVYVHYGPGWTTKPITEASPNKRWIYTLPVQLPNDKRTHILAGGKWNDPELAELRLLTPGQSRADSWTSTLLSPIGWTMSLFQTDMNHDGQPDFLVSDRRGPERGISWYQFPTWERHPIALQGREVMFLDHGDINKDGLADIAAAVRPNAIVWLERLDKTGLKWREHIVPYPPNAGTAKAVAIGDLNNDGRADLAFTCENSRGGKEGVWWLEQLPNGEWRSHRISGPEGIKFDRIELLDLDGDSDLDLITTEEITPLGIIWYENPTRL
jgi:hypothetical protein